MIRFGLISNDPLLKLSAVVLLHSNWKTRYSTCDLEHNNVLDRHKAWERQITCDV